MEQNLSPNQELTFMIADPSKHYNVIFESFTKIFSQIEPMTSAVGTTPEDIDRVYREIIDLALKQPYSILAFLGDQCVGWSLNLIKNEIQKCDQDPSLSFNPDLGQAIANQRNDNIRANQVEAVIDEIERNYGFYIPDCKKLFKLDVLYVNPKYGGKGIGTKLTQKSIEIARENECDYLMTCASASGSSKIFKNAGMKCVREIPFDSFMDNGERIFPDLHDGNKTLKLFFLKLE